MRRSARRAALGFAALALAAGLLAPAVVFGAPVGTLDVHQDIHSLAVRLNQGAVSQPFTAGLTGNLTTVSLYLSKASTDVTDALPIQIRDTTAGGALLASATIPASDVQVDAGGWVDVVLAGPVPSVAGHVYVIVVPQAGTEVVTYNWFWPDGGGPFTGFTMATINGVLQDQPMAFRTYVSPAAEPTPQPTPRPTAVPSVTTPPTSTLPPVTTGGSSSGALLLLAGLGLFASVGLVAATTRGRSRR